MEGTATMTVPEIPVPTVDNGINSQLNQPLMVSKKQMKRDKKKHPRTTEEIAALAEFRTKRRRQRKERKRAAKALIEEAKPEYTIENGYRFVKPYPYQFQTRAKERWFGRTLFNMFTEEFGAYPPEYYHTAIESGRITVNGEIVSPDTIINNLDLIVHKAHRHEPPVLGDAVEIAYEDDEVLVVNKPPSMPTHPCGAYRHNSLHTIVQLMRPDIPILNIVHRLDRLTSGIVIMAKSAAKANVLSNCIADREASKTYLARVRGHLSTANGFAAATKEQLIATATKNCTASVITFIDDHTMEIDCPLLCISPKDAISQCHADGKPSQTRVRVISIGNQTTLVECKPITGRTHQIRLHLQLLGFPIANDPCYGGELHFGESLERRAVIAAAEHAKNAGHEANAQTGSQDSQDFTTPQREDEDEDAFLIRTCPWCHIGREQAYNETQLHCSRIWLHALEYKLGGHVFRVPNPPWASPSDDY